MGRTPSPARRLASMAAGGLGRVVFVLALLALVTTFVPTLLGYHRYVLVGSSMEPTIHKGSLVFDEVVPQAALRRGDVITYVPPALENPVTHRIVSIQDQRDGTRVFRTKGDNNARADMRPFVLEQPRQARVAFAVPGLGWLFIVLAMQWARVLLLALPAVLLAAWALAGLWRQGGELVAEQRAGIGPEGS